MKPSANLRAILAIFTMLSCGAYGPANADGLYFGGGVYASTAEVNSFKETDETTGFLIGYNLIDSNVFMFSVELGAYDLGEYSEDQVEIEADALTLGAVATLPVGPFIELYGKLGLAEVEVEVNGEDFDGSETYYGLGIAFDLFDTVDIFLEYLEFDTEVDSNSVGVGVRLDLF